MEIRKISSSQDLENVFRFRYEIYVTEMNRNQIYCDHITKKIQEPLDLHANIYAAFDSSGKIVGTLRSNYLESGGLTEYIKLYEIFKHDPKCTHKISITTKLMVAKSQRGSLLAKSLITTGYNSLLKDGIEYDFIDVNPHMIKFYSRMGYIPLREMVHPEFGDVTLMKLPVQNFNHLSKVKSPFYSLTNEQIQQDTLFCQVSPC